MQNNENVVFFIILKRLTVFFIVFRVPKDLQDPQDLLALEEWL